MWSVLKVFLLGQVCHLYTVHIEGVSLELCTTVTEYSSTWPVHFKSACDKSVNGKTQKIHKLKVYMI